MKKKIKRLLSGILIMVGVIVLWLVIQHFVAGVFERFSNLGFYVTAGGMLLVVIILLYLLGKKNGIFNILN